jgi:hypothetical protein
MLAEAGEPERTGTANARPVFPYSVVPGGVRNSQELQNAVAGDSVVAKHYAGFTTGSARAIRLAEQRTAYVSYRMGNQIFWTRRKVTLRAGEIVLTDGQNMIRGRCGNRVSTTPKYPTSPHEPPENAMSKPEFSTDPGPIGVPSWTYPPVNVSLAASGTPLTPGGDIPPGYIGPIPIGSSSGGKSPDTPPVLSVAAAEPASGMLIVSGLFLLLWLRARKVI